MSDFKLRLKPAIEPEIEFPGLFCLLSVFFIILGILLYYLDEHDMVTCTVSNRVVPCTHSTSYLFIIGGAIFLTLSFVCPILNKKTIYHMHFDCYADHIERWYQNKQMNNYYVTPDSTIFIKPQRKNTTKHSSIGTIVVCTPMSGTFSLPNIRNYKQIHKQLCKLYHVTKTSMPDREPDAPMNSTN